MFKLPAVCLCTFFTATILSACGNKGELFLPVDPQLTRELDVIGESVDLPADEDTDETDTSEKRTRQPKQRSKPTQ